MIQLKLVLRLHVHFAWHAYDDDDGVVYALGVRLPSRNLSVLTSVLWLMFTVIIYGIKMVCHTVCNLFICYRNKFILTEYNSSSLNRRATWAYSVKLIIATNPSQRHYINTHSLVFTDKKWQAHKPRPWLINRCDWMPSLPFVQRSNRRTDYMRKLEIARTKSPKSSSWDNNYDSLFTRWPIQETCLLRSRVWQRRKRGAKFIHASLEAHCLFATH